MGSSNFNSASEFCSDCGAILPFIQQKGLLTCYVCSREFSVEKLGDTERQFTINFNLLEHVIQDVNNKNRKATEAEGPVVERKCVKCGNDTMSYATLQLRSADEGQTVFYTCTKCGHKESENS